MRLLNVNTRELHEFNGDRIPPYAIFSHVGEGAGEVTYQEWQRVRQHARADRLFLNCDAVLVDESKSIQDKPGFAKINNFISTLNKVYPHIEWAHIHNVCVNRSSSAEVDEAVNSCFGWCQRAATCLAFLDDVPIDLWPLKANPAEFSRARWFRRSWALIELVAPLEVRFFDSKFNFLSTRRELSDVLHTITKVDERFLTGNGNPKSVSAAHRIAWAANRETSRPEDTVYCLMGLLDVHMTPMYGEGKEAAFRRLQAKALKRTGDASLLAWGFHGGGTGLSLTPAQRTGPFAALPAQFAACQGITPTIPITASQACATPEFKITNRGVWITTTLLRPPHTDRSAAFSTDYVYAVLGCSYEKGQVLLPLLPARRSSRANGMPNGSNGTADNNSNNITECDEFWRAPSCTPICIRQGLVPLDQSRRRTVLILRDALPVEVLSLRIQGLDSAGYRMALQEIWPPTVCRDGAHYKPIDDGHTPQSPANGSSSNGYYRRSRSGSSGGGGGGGGRNSSSTELSAPVVRTQWILLRLWTYFENVIVMIRYRGRALQEAPAQLLPALSPRQINPVEVQVKVLSLAQLMEDYSSPVNEGSLPLPRSLEDYFWNREPTADRLEALFAMKPRFRHPEPVRAIVSKPVPNLNYTHERHEQHALKRMGYRLPLWTVRLEFDKANLGTAASLCGL
ncbi:hypothetical protein RB595_005391 [Gaeumannomyces hyphopodioides]